MNNIAKYVVLNGTYAALTRDNIIVGHIIPEHLIVRPSRRVMGERNKV